MQSTATVYTQNIRLCKFLGFRPEVDEISALLGYCEAQSGNSVLTFRYGITTLLCVILLINVDLNFQLLQRQRLLLRSRGLLQKKAVKKNIQKNCKLLLSSNSKLHVCCFERTFPPYTVISLIYTSVIISFHTDILPPSTFAL